MSNEAMPNEADSHSPPSGKTFDKDSIANTLVVAIGVCLVCSLLVSGAAVGLRSLQQKNRTLDIKRNILSVAGLTREEISEAGGVEQVFKERFETIIIDLDTGKRAEGKVQELLEFESEAKAVELYDQIEVTDLGNPKLSDRLPKQEDSAGIKRREKYSHVYLLQNQSGAIEKYIFPVRGRGLWSVLKGFIALESDLQTVAGITFYEHAETPGLGGEIDNQNWKKKWPGKRVYANQGDLEDDGSVPPVELQVVKGSADSEFEIDGLSGATITSRGVSQMVEFWLGESGFGPYISRQKQENPVAARQAAGPAINKVVIQGASDG